MKGAILILYSQAIMNIGVNEIRSATYDKGTRSLKYHLGHRILECFSLKELHKKANTILDQWLTGTKIVNREIIKAFIKLYYSLRSSPPLQIVSKSCQLYDWSVGINGLLLFGILLSSRRQ